MHQVGFSFHDYIEMRGQQNTKNQIRMLRVDHSSSAVEESPNGSVPASNLSHGRFCAIF